jgi:hypothetical protein
VKSRHSGNNSFWRSRFLRSFLFSSLWVGVLTSLYVSAAAAEKEREVPQEGIERYEDAKEAARNQRIEGALEENETGTDPRSFKMFGLTAR